MVQLCTPPSPLIHSCVSSSKLPPLRGRVGSATTEPSSLEKSVTEVNDVADTLRLVTDDRLLVFHCIDVNNSATPIQQQLTCSGIGDVVRRRSRGLTHHFTCLQFLLRYGVFVPWDEYLQLRGVDIKRQCRVCEAVFEHPDVAAALATVEQPFAVEVDKGVVRHCNDVSSGWRRRCGSDTEGGVVFLCVSVCPCVCVFVCPGVLVSEGVQQPETATCVSRCCRLLYLLGSAEGRLCRELRRWLCRLQGVAP